MLKIAGARKIVPRKIASPRENSPPVKLPSRIIAPPNPPENYSQKIVPPEIYSLENCPWYN